MQQCACVKGGQGEQVEACPRQKRIVRQEQRIVKGGVCATVGPVAHRQGPVWAQKDQAVPRLRKNDIKPAKLIASTSPVCPGRMTYLQGQPSPKPNKGRNH